MKFLAFQAKTTLSQLLSATAMKLYSFPIIFKILLYAQSSVQF